LLSPQGELLVIAAKGLFQTECPVTIVKARKKTALANHPIKQKKQM